MEINVEELKKAAPIIDYVKKHYNHKIKIVEESGHCAKAFCIWHNETDSPSLAFFENGSYKCFGECGNSGDVITLVQKLENLTFQEACKLIGDNVGYEVILTPPNPYHESYKAKMTDYTRRYWYNFQMNEDAKDYMINQRGLTKETLDTFRIGLTDVNEYKFRNDIGGISNRISFPILESKMFNPKCIGMGYRALKNDKPKYINDRNQEGGEKQDPNLSGVFVKGNTLYGYNVAYPFIKEYGFAILVEGYVDVLSLHQSGLKNTVSSMGTSVTEAQIDLISKVTKSVMLILDSDKAGISAMMKTLPMLLSKGMTIVVCTLNKGIDPADLCLQHHFNYNKVYGIIKENSEQAELFLINKSVSKYESIINRERQKAFEMALPIIETISNPVQKELYMNLLYKRLDLRR